MAHLLMRQLLSPGFNTAAAMGFLEPIAHSPRDYVFSVYSIFPEKTSFFL
jgi:hypothetical protein